LKASKHITKSARIFIRQTIRENNGGEVFFIGKQDENGMIADVDAYAFGGKNAVPVLLRLVEYGDVVLHNHPDGNLEPSEADVDSAGSLGDLGVGSYIVNNECTGLHITVRAFKETDIELLKKDEILSLFSEKGTLAKTIREYEHRPEQIDMAKAVIRGFNENLICVIEAGTGTGKSLAYLIPAIRWSLYNKQRVIVSTNTINLQEQLVGKDLPLLRDKCKLDFKSELMKGRQNYLCLRRANYVKGERLWLESEKDRKVFQLIFDWSGKTSDGSLSDLNVSPPREIWERICCEPDTCLRTRCRFYQECFFYQARRRAARADIVVVNHHLLMADLSLRSITKNYTAAAVLPPFRRIIIDEAHNIEQVATNYFTVRITRFGILYHLRRLASRPKEKREKGLLSFLSEKLFHLEKKHSSLRLPRLVETIRNQVIPGVHSTASLVQAEFRTLTGEFLSLVRESGMDFEQNISLRVVPEIEESFFWTDALSSCKNRITTALRRFVSILKQLLEELEQLPEKLLEEVREPCVEISALKERLELASSHWRYFYNGAEAHCRWLEYKPEKYKRPESLKLCIAPIDVRENMRKAIYDVNHTVVMTSATLAVENRFDFIIDLLGLAPIETNQPEEKRKKDAPLPAFERLLTRKLGTSFDFENQAFVGVATDLPDPSAPGFPHALGTAIMKAINISRGKALVLFTSYRLMDKLFKQLEELIVQMGYPCYCQGQEPRHKLLQKFIREKHAVLFATASFWEGVDVKGESLECLVITRLPFRVPTEPLLQARAEALQLQGRDPFRELDLPQAVIKFKQGFGRLIRSRMDRGAILIFDRRVATKYYGRTFLSSLPTKKILKLPSAKLFKEMKTFFR